LSREKRGKRKKANCPASLEENSGKKEGTDLRIRRIGGRIFYLHLFNWNAKTLEEKKRKGTGKN